MTNQERLEKVEEDIFNVNEALEHLEQVAGVEGAVDDLNEKVVALMAERDECRRLVEQDDAWEDRQLVREYEKDLL